jgi:lysophospholipase L1-like esterase
MSDPSLFAATLLANGPLAQTNANSVAATIAATPPRLSAVQIDTGRSPFAVAEPIPTVQPETNEPLSSFSFADPRLPARGPSAAFPHSPRLPSQNPTVPQNQLMPQRPVGTRTAIAPPTVFAPRTTLPPQPAIVPPPIIAPRNNTELYYQRLAALQAGKLYTRLSTDSFAAAWQGASQSPTYRQWRRLLAAEARAVAWGQGSNRLAVLVGDSISQWYPSDRLPQHQLWLNQSISGDTTRGILNRLPDFAGTRPQTIYVMAGVNDLKNGVADPEILGNLRGIILGLRQQHPQAQVIVQSILPTQSPRIPNHRIVGLNQQLAAIAQSQGATFLDLHTHFTNAQDQIRPELTTDGIHLTALGYATWQTALQQTGLLLARRW